MRFVLFAALLLTLQASCFDSPHPSDAALESVFRNHQADFELLLSMSRADSKVMRIAPDFTWLVDDASWPRPEDKLGFSEERWNQYRELFRKLSLQSGLLTYRDQGTTYFLASSKGLVTGGSGKGYVYSEKELIPVSSSLDDISTETLKSSSNGMVYKKIGGNWYLFYDAH